MIREPGRYPLLMIAAVLLIGGAYRQHQDGSEAVIAAGLVVLGAWLAVEVEHLRAQHRKEVEPGPRDRAALRVSPVDPGRYSLRTGRKVGRTLYLWNEDTSSADDDILVGLVDSPGFADEIVRRWNKGPG